MMSGKKEELLCCGCSACKNVCPVQAIELVQNKKGFYSPVINQEKCISCGKCDDVCQIKNTDKVKFNNEPKAFGMKLKDENERKKSCSGGLFYALAEKIIECGGVVFGAKMREDFSVCHAEARNKEELEALRGVKYVQSDMGDIYARVKKELGENRKVLFSGTPCQVAGLYAFLGNSVSYDGLYTADLLCHGVPSPRVWADMVKEYRKPGQTLQSVTFRDKSAGWGFGICRQGITADGQFHFDDRFTKLYMRHFILNEACHSCKYTRLQRTADITMGDFWGIEKYAPDFYDNKGVSLALVNTKKGGGLFGLLENEEITACDDLQACMQKMLISPSQS